MCSASLSGGILDVSLPYQQLMDVVDRRTGRPAAANFQLQVSLAGPLPCLSNLADAAEAMENMHGCWSV